MNQDAGYQATNEVILGRGDNTRSDDWGSMLLERGCILDAAFKCQVVVSIRFVYDFSHVTVYPMERLMAGKQEIK